MNNGNETNVHTANDSISKPSRVASSRMKWRFAAIGMSALLLLMMTGCVPGDGSYSPADPAGFFWGIWHGWIAPITLIGGLFNDSWMIYEPINTGWPYEFGFYIAIISGFGGLSLRRRKKD